MDSPASGVSGTGAGPGGAGREVVAETRRFGRAAGLLSIGVGSAGFLTYVYFALASHTLEKSDYGEIVVLWSAVFITVSTLFRPVEQLLSRTIAERRAQRQRVRQTVRVAATIQLLVALLFAALALALRGPLEDELLSGDETLYWILVAAVVGFGASFFVRGFLAGSHRFALYASVLIVESITRVSFALAVAVGIAEGQAAIALGIAAAPVVSLVVVPFAVRARSRRRAERATAAPAAPTGAPAARPLEGPEFTLAHGGGFAAAVLVIMLSEQAFLNAGPLLVRASLDAAAAGFIFNVLMVARAPLVLFQAVATSLLPHLTRLRSRETASGDEAFRLSIRVTLAAIAAFAAGVALVVAVAGPELMQLAFGDKFAYDRAGLLTMSAAMGFYLCASTLNQAALAQGKARRAAACYGACALAFVGFNLLPVLDEFRRVEVGFAGGAALLCALLYLLYRQPRGVAADIPRPGSPQELELEIAAADEAGGT